MQDYFLHASTYSTFLYPFDFIFKRPLFIPVYWFLQKFYHYTQMHES